MAGKKKLTVKDRIKAVNKTMGKLVAAGDAKGLAANYTRNARLMAPNAPLFKGRKAIGAFWEGALKMGIGGASLRTQDVEDHGQTAIETGAYTLTGPGKAVLDTGKYVVVWKREGRDWLLHWDIFNSNNPPPAG